MSDYKKANELLREAKVWTFKASKELNWQDEGDTKFRHAIDKIDDAINDLRKELINKEHKVGDYLPK